MTGRQRNIDVVTWAGQASEDVAATYECHGGYPEGSNPFGREEWKYYEFIRGEPKKCQTHGKLKDGTGYARGISMWQPPCFPKTMVDNRNELTLKCKILADHDPPPTEFTVLRDRIYTTLIVGRETEFVHYLLTPSGQLTESAVNDARGNLVTTDGSFEAGGGTHNIAVIDFDDCERAVGPLDACQCSLKEFVNDPSNAESDRCDAMVLYAWIGSLEATVDELVSLSPWGSEFILKGMRKYGRDPTADFNYLMDFEDAVASLAYQLERYRSEQQKCMESRPRIMSDQARDIGRKTLVVVKTLAKTVNRCSDWLVVKWDCVYDGALVDCYKTQVEILLRDGGVSFTTSRVMQGSIVLAFRIDGISAETFDDVVKELENRCPDACGVGIADAGGTDIFQDETDEYTVNFGKWVNLLAREDAPVIIKDTVAPSPLLCAVYCQSLSKRGECCKNKTKDPSRRCWRHRG